MPISSQIILGKGITNGNRVRESGKQQIGLYDRNSKETGQEPIPADMFTNRIEAFF